MQNKHALSLRTKVLTLIALVVVLAFTLTIGVLTWQASALQTEVSGQYLEQLARTHGNQLAARVEAALDASRTLANSLRGLRSAGLSNRVAADAMQKSVLEAYPEILGVWTCWEPNAFDGKDAEFAGKPGHDATGRYIPYWNRANGSIAQEPLLDYEKPGAGDYYLLAKQSGVETLIEPFSYKVGGKDILMTSVVIPMTIDGVFVGMVGMDLPLDGFQAVISKIRPYDTGFVSLISHSGLYVADGDAKNLGKSVGDTDQDKAAKAAIQSGQTYAMSHFSERLQTAARTTYVPLHMGVTQSIWSLAVTVQDDKTTRRWPACMRCATSPSRWGCSASSL